MDFTTCGWRFSGGIGYGQDVLIFKLVDYTMDGPSRVPQPHYAISSISIAGVQFTAASTKSLYHTPIFPHISAFWLSAPSSYDLRLDPLIPTSFNRLVVDKPQDEPYLFRISGFMGMLSRLTAKEKYGLITIISAPEVAGNAAHRDVSDAWLRSSLSFSCLNGVAGIRQKCRRMEKARAAKL
ncbi:hypothetical protein ARMSODRAFT_983673 [Armillaria solidipes]|uniref:Uncharacterized protein n=1 Tax=Armillaria solidipes TaxID=1076256 RepID=A0A2H3B484_9AGAR|nr:hypothetical protein ARMSODRAFT_983673 [Armillaria solidipes]